MKLNLMTWNVDWLRNRVRSTGEGKYCKDDCSPLVYQEIIRIVEEFLKKENAAVCLQEFPTHYLKQLKKDFPNAPILKEKDFLDADQLGYNAVCYNEFNEIISDFDYIFSTVPARVFEEHHIRDMKKSVVYFELASAPYGCDKSLFEKCDKKYIMGNALPGRYCAKSWAEEAVRYCFDNLKGDNI